MAKNAFFQSKNRYLPHISRLFSVRLIFLVIVGVFFGILASILLQIQPRQILAVSSQNLAKSEASYNEWKQIVAERPDYRDGYMMLAWYSRELGKNEEAKSYIQKVLALDPNFIVPEIFLGETVR
jgi:hypothetical protein